MASSLWSVRAYISLYTVSYTHLDVYKRQAEAYGRCPSYPIFEGISAIIEAFGLDSPYVLQRTCQYILDLGYPLIYENLKLARPTFEQIVDRCV